MKLRRIRLQLLRMEKVKTSLSFEHEGPKLVSPNSGMVRTKTEEHNQPLQGSKVLPILNYQYKLLKKVSLRIVSTILESG